MVTLPTTKSHYYTIGHFTHGVIIANLAAKGSNGLTQKERHERSVLLALDDSEMLAKMTGRGTTGSVTIKYKQ